MEIHYQKWSADVMKATEGSSCGNLREMHQLSAVGVGKAIIFDDDKKTIAMTFKVVDDNAWRKTIGGCYSAYSQGGYYERLWTGKDGLPHYTARPVGISLVDRPALPGTTFQFVHADGRVEMRKFVGGLTEADPFRDGAGRFSSKMTPVDHYREARRHRNLAAQYRSQGDQQTAQRHDAIAGRHEELATQQRASPQAEIQAAAAKVTDEKIDAYIGMWVPEKRPPE